MSDTIEIEYPSLSEALLLADLDLEDTSEWCICYNDNPDVSLCGIELTGVSLPNEEVPNEQTCPECMRIWEQSSNKTKP